MLPEGVSSGKFFRGRTLECVDTAFPSPDRGCRPGNSCARLRGPYSIDAAGSNAHRYRGSSVACLGHPGRLWHVPAMESPDPRRARPGLDRRAVRNQASIGGRRSRQYPFNHRADPRTARAALAGAVDGAGAVLLGAALSHRKPAPRRSAVPSRRARVGHHGPADESATSAAGQTRVRRDEHCPEAARRTGLGRQRSSDELEPKRKGAESA